MALDLTEEHQERKTVSGSDLCLGRREPDDSQCGKGPAVEYRYGMTASGRQILGSVVRPYTLTACGPCPSDGNRPQGGEHVVRRDYGIARPASGKRTARKGVVGTEALTTCG
jgi:hypothetical protein